MKIDDQSRFKTAEEWMLLVKGSGDDSPGDLDRAFFALENSAMKLVEREDDTVEVRTPDPKIGEAIGHVRLAIARLQGVISMLEDERAPRYCGSGSTSQSAGSLPS